MTTCLLIIDLFNDCLDHLPPERVEQLVTNTNNLTLHFRVSNLPIVWVRQEFAPDLSDAFLEMRRRGIKTAIAGTTGAQLDRRLDVRSEDKVLVKKRYSAFFGTELDRVIQANRVTHLVLAGINIHACVRTTAVDAYQRDLEVILAAECLDGYDELHSEISMRYMSGKIASVENNRTVKERLKDG